MGFCIANVRQWLLTLLAGLWLVGCAALYPVGSEKWHEHQKASIAERAESRWAAIMAGDMEKAYFYLSPNYRDVVSLQQYRATMGRVIDWRVAKARSVGYDSPTVASVSVEVAYRVEMPLSKGVVIENTSRLTEKWIYDGGEWWYTAQ